MSEVDYGYGDEPAAETDYGYGDEPAAETDYGYGDDPAADGADYGYGDAAPATDDYGYGDAAPATDDYGYGDEPTPLPKAAGRPKRRCSVTKFSLDSGPPPPEMVLQTPEAPPEIDEKSTEATISCNVSDDGEETDQVSTELDMGSKKKKSGMMSKIRKRMSLAF
jgi:hypothetical protein